MSPASTRILLVFVDGIGVGGPDPAVNPFAVRDRFEAIERLTGGSLTSATPETSEETSLYRRIDANLGVDGLPQSGTGQATLFTGVNCAELAGRHYGPFPHSSSKPVIRKGNLFSDVLESSGIHPVFANAYPDRFFRYVERTDRWTVTTLCCEAAGIRLMTGKDLGEGRAVSADITGRSWPEPWPGHEPITANEAGRRLTRIAQDTHLTVFEYFETDKAGHSRDFERARTVLERLDGLIEGILQSLGADQTLVVTSDHGNLEDLSTKTHTRNPVPFIAFGPATHHFRTVKDLTGVAPAVVRAVAG